MFKYRVIGYHKDDLIYGGANMTIYTSNKYITCFVKLDKDCCNSTKHSLY